MSNEPQHWPTERMIQEQHADYATAEDLEGLDEGLLIDISQICEVPTAAPDECIPCLAYAMVMERRNEAAKKALEEMTPQVSDYEPEERETPKLDALMQSEPPWEEEKPEREPVPFPGENRHADPVREIQRVAQYLDRLVEEALHGPPIPPREVSEADLALLVVAAQRWIKITDAQGVELAPSQQQILDATKALVARLHRGNG